MSEFTRTVEIEKLDEEQRIVWGWAYVCEDCDGQVVDHSGDITEAVEVQKAAHGFVSDSRDGGLLHQGKAGTIVDSIFFSKAVQDALGIDLGRVGWFIGYRVDDDAAWAGVKDGTYAAFSIGGSADTDDLTKGYNPDQPREADGKFGSGGGSGGGDADRASAARDLRQAVATAGPGTRAADAHASEQRAAGAFDRADPEGARARADQTRAHTAAAREALIGGADHHEATVGPHTVRIARRQGRKGELHTVSVRRGDRVVREQSHSSRDAGLETFAHHVGRESRNEAARTTPRAARTPNTQE